MRIVNTLLLSLVVYLTHCYGAVGAPADCGLDWNAPLSHFDGVDYQGYVKLIRQIGLLNVDGTEINVYINFSSRERESPYLGAGWELPLLESNIVQLSENVFVWNKPDGRYRFFHRIKGSPSTLNGGTWMGEITGDIIQIWNDCGNLLRYKSGKISSMKIGSAKLDFQYRDGAVREVFLDGARVIDIQSNAGKTEFRFGKADFVAVDLSPRKLIQEVQGRRVVAAVKASVSKISRSGEQDFNVDYPIDEKLFPAIDYGGRRLTWNPSNGRIVSDGEIQYSVEKPDNPYMYAPIERTIGSGATEYWYKAMHKGYILEKSAGGVFRRTNYFTSGVFRGAIRSVYEGATVATQDKLLLKNSYSENGGLLRTVTDQGIRSFEYGTNGSVRVFEGGRLVRLKEVYLPGIVAEEFVGPCFQFYVDPREIQEGTLLALMSEVYSATDVDKVLIRIVNDQMSVQLIDQSGRMLLHSGFQSMLETNISSQSEGTSIGNFRRMLWTMVLGYKRKIHSDFGEELLMDVESSATNN